MASLTLTRASRLQERIRAAVRDLPLTAYATLSIFAPDPAVAVEREAARLREDVDVLARLLSILAQLRAATGRANAQHGVADLLAEKAAVDEEVSLLIKLIPGQVAPGDFDELVGGARQQRFLRRHPGEIEAQVSAMRARYEQTERSQTTIEAPLLDGAEAARLRERLVARRRRLEEIGDQLREMNGRVRIEIDDDALAYLREREVI
jgi:hypothetical protein